MDITLRQASGRKLRVFCIYGLASCLLIGLIFVSFRKYPSFSSLDRTFSFTVSDPSENKNGSTILSDRLERMRLSSLLNHTEHRKLHLLIPSSSPDINLCKTLLGAAILDYPTPTLLAWKKKFHDSNQMVGGAHIGKISAVLDHLAKMKPEQDNELVFVMDAYDIWFQFPKDVLLARYDMINAEANARIEEQMGTETACALNITQTIIFAAGKKCAPNQLHTIACYPIPQSPLPVDLYGGNTDTDIGRNEHYSHRQRYLNSGYVMGPVRDMRRLFTRAIQKVKNHTEPDPRDNGSGGSRFMYLGSDQAFFADIFGEQSYQREVMRQRYLSSTPLPPSSTSASPRIPTPPLNLKDYFKHPKSHPSTPKLTPHKRTSIDTVPYDDPINPPFHHERMSHNLPDLSHEYGIGLDYFSDLGHQTVNSELDARFIRYDWPLPSPNSRAHSRPDFDCPQRLHKNLSADVLEAEPKGLVERVSNGTRKGWRGVSLYSHLCIGSVPVMVHHNGDKEARKRMWGRIWWQEFARGVMEGEMRGGVKGKKMGKGEWEEHLREPGRGLGREWGGAWTDQAEFLPFGKLCPKKFEEEIFRDEERREREKKEKEAEKEKAAKEKAAKEKAAKEKAAKEKEAQAKKAKSQQKNGS